MNVEDKVIVITGASSGVGRAAALAFAKERAHVVIAARNKVALDEVAGECRRLGAEVFVVKTDVSEDEQVRKLAKHAWDWKGRIDVWVNNAGVLAAGAFEKIPAEVHRQVVMTNLMGYIYGAHAVIPYFKKQGHGVLINNISIGGFVPTPYAVGYTTSKFGLRGFAESLRGELAEWPHIYVSNLYPGFLNTPGIIHAANYTGKVLKAAPPVYDPAEVAAAMVSVANKPGHDKYVGAISPLLTVGSILFPGLVAKLAAKFIASYFRRADAAPEGPGNVFDTVGDMAVYGRKDERKMTRILNLTAGALAVAGIALAWLAEKPNTNRK